MPRAGAGEAPAGWAQRRLTEESMPNQRVRCFVSSMEQGQQASRAITVCGEVLASDPENVNVLKDRAEAYLQEEQYEEGKPEGSWR